MELLIVWNSYTLESIIYVMLSALLAIMCHEIGHALMSTWLGDPTPKRDGRISFNPIKHFDPIGFLCLIFFHFGWAKPVMVNPSYYKKPKRDMALVALAGPLTNFILCILSAFLYAVCYKYMGGNIRDIFLIFFSYMVLINLGLGLFNLIPIPPLDGSKMLGVFLPNDTYIEFMKFERYGFVILLLLLFLFNQFGGDFLGELEIKIGNYLIRFFLNII